MRVLLVAHGYPPESVGGVEQHVAGLAQALVQAGHDVHVLAKTGRAGPAQCGIVDDPQPATPAPRVSRLVYRYEGLTDLRSLYEVPAVETAVGSWLAEHRFDVAHLHHLTGLSTGLVRAIEARGIPTLLTLHDYWTICPRGQMWRDDGTVCEFVEPATCATCLRPSFGGWIPQDGGAERVADLHDLARQTLGAATRLIVPSARARPPFVQLGIPAENILVVENGVDTSSLQAVPLAPTLPERPLRLGFFGTVIPSKGLDVLVDALLRLPPGSATLAIHGNTVPYHGDTGYATRVFSKLDPQRCRAIYHGPYSTTELPALLAGIDVLVAPALWREAFGLTVREALAAGRPVVASRIGGLQDAFEDGREGRYVPAGDVQALAGVLEELVNDRTAVERMARAGRAGAARRGFQPMADELLEIYRAVTRP